MEELDASIPPGEKLPAGPSCVRVHHDAPPRSKPGSSANTNLPGNRAKPQNKGQNKEKTRPGTDLCSRGGRRYRQLQESRGRPSDGQTDRANTGNGFCGGRLGLRKRQRRRFQELL